MIVYKRVKAEVHHFVKHDCMNDTMGTLRKTVVNNSSFALDCILFLIVF